ncbi:MAG: hypothetical protein DME17_09850 [Candidatus Rokuibacteriota bacterium]|nr:MAG: hypothetical protein DME17_09850 [Candidatus Rokubacteria bacterium]
MSTLSRISLLAVCVLLLQGAVGARERGDPATPTVTGPQEVDVVAVMLDPRTQQPVVIMEGRRDKRSLTMAIGLAEANGIAVPLQGVKPPRPLTHDLIMTLFDRLHVSLKRVVITDVRDDIYYALVTLGATGSEMTLDARPSDAIALAIRAKVPVLVEDRVFDKAGGGAVEPGTRERI